MQWLKCTVLVTTLCAAYWQDSAAQRELTNNTVENSSLEILKENEKNFKSTNSTEYETLPTAKMSHGSAATLTGDLQNQLNITEISEAANITALSPEVEINLKSGVKTGVANVTFNDIKPFLFFPILPFLFPPKEKDNQTLENQFLGSKNEKVKTDGSPNDVKPFIFFDFAFIRKIPLNNRSNSTSDSNIINVKKVNISKDESFKKNFQKNRRRRNTSSKMETSDFFDESPLFPDSELDEFLPKSDLFFPDLPFHHRRSLKKLSRRKRDQKKPDLKSDLKYFFDAFDEAFMRTKRELERTDPILNFLKGNQQSFDDDKKEDVFGHIPNIQEKPRMKWRIQQNIKRLKNDHQEDTRSLRKTQDGPMIIVDKVVKIGEFHMHDEGHEKDKLKKRKRENESKNKLTTDEMTSFEKDEIFPNNIFDLIKQEESKRKKRNHSTKSDGQNVTVIQSTEIRILPEMSVSDLSVGSNTSELKKREIGDDPQVNGTNKNLRYENLMKVMDSLKAKMKVELKNEADPSLGKLKEKGTNYYEKLNSKKISYDNLKKNISELLNQFLELTKNSNDFKLVDRPEHGEAGIFDWTEKETLLNTNILGKNSRERRQKKDTDFVDEYIDLTKKERQIVDLDYLFLTVTLPTVFVFALALLVCFFSLQVKGKICSRLFRPRQVFIVDNEKPMQFEKHSAPQTSLKVQAL